MTWLIIAVFAVAFFALIMASIALHEVGHLVPAKLFGVKVTQYFVGFGKTLWSRTIKGTEYGIKAIPLGGYVRLIGMYPPGKPGRSKWLDKVAAEARSAEAADITPMDDGTLFYQKKTWQKLIVMLGGPMMNLFLAFVIFCSINMFHGQYREQLTIAYVNDCIIPASRAERVCQPGDPQTPAKRAGVLASDKIVKFNDVVVRDWAHLSELIRANSAGPVALTVERAGQRVKLPTVNTVITGVADRLDPSRRVEAGFLGVGPSVEQVRSGPVTTISDMWLMTQRVAVALVGFPVKVWNVATDLITGKPRDINGPLSVIGASMVAGEIAVKADIPLGDRVASWFSLLGAVNLFVALLNLVPLLPLDGGHIAGAIYEWLKRKLARLFGRPDPGHADTAKLLPVVYVVAAFLLIAGAVLILADLISPIKIF